MTVTPSGRSGRRAGPATLVAVLVFTAVVMLAAPVLAHGSGPPARPVVTGIEPAGAGVTATAVFLGGWRIELASTARDTVSVLDGDGRPFLRFSPGGVEADFGARAWFETNIVTSGKVVAPDVKAGDPADWRRVSSQPVWSWLDTRIRPEQSLFTTEVLRSKKPVRLRDFEIPVRIGERPARIAGRLESEPPVGRYRHTILSGPEPFPGLRVAEVAGTVAPTFTLENHTGATVTVLGEYGEPMARMRGELVEANLLSPSWVPIGQMIGLVPAVAPDPAAAPRWERIFEGVLWSWPDVRSRPPDAELPPLSLSKRGTVTVRRWEIPIEVGSQRVTIRGMTEVIPRIVTRTAVPASGWPVATVALLVVAGGASCLFQGWSGVWRRGELATR